MYSIYFIVPMVATSILGMVGTVFGGIMTYKANKRVASGSVSTSNATELWAENGRVIDRLSKEVDRLTNDVVQLRAEVDRLRDERDEARKEKMSLQDKLHALQIEMLKLQGTPTSKVTTITETSNPVPVHPIEVPDANVP